jgi:hypothetical protein
MWFQCRYNAHKIHLIKLGDIYLKYFWMLQKFNEMQPQIIPHTRRCSVAPAATCCGRHTSSDEAWDIAAV